MTCMFSQYNKNVLGIAQSVIFCHSYSIFCSTDVYALPGFGGGNGSIFMDNIRCTGEEWALGDCVHNGIGVHDCPPDHSHDAGIFCDTSIYRQHSLRTI